MPAARWFVMICLTVLLNCITGGDNRVVKKPNNVCSTYEDYLIIQTSKKCWYNPDVDADMYTMVLSKGYPLEDYNVTTSDGYILTIFRLPRKENYKGIVFLEHPVTTNSLAFVGFGPKNSWAFALYEEGYDVWLGNARGTDFGRKHVNLDPEKLPFWEFSYHEIGYYDIPAIVDFIRTKTKYKQKLSILGHSLGGTTLLVYACTRPDHAKENVKLMIPMSPFTRNKHIKSSIVKASAPLLTNDLMDFLHKYQFFEPFRKNGLFHNLRTLSCTIGGVSYFICHFLDLVTTGISKEAAPEYTPIIAVNTPHGFSLKTIVHICQGIASTKFRQFDYGIAKNMQIYQQEFPPEYAVQNISIPTYFIFGGTDTIDTPEDIKDVYNDMHPSTKIFGYNELKGFNHFDPLFSKHVREKAILPVFKILEKVQEK